MRRADNDNCDDRLECRGFETAVLYGLTSEVSGPRVVNLGVEAHRQTIAIRGETLGGERLRTTHAQMEPKASPATVVLRPINSDSHVHSVSPLDAILFIGAPALSLPHRVFQTFPIPR